MTIFASRSHENHFHGQLGALLDQMDAEAQEKAKD